MPVKISRTSGDLLVGQPWLLRVEATDVNRQPISTVAPVITLTSPAGVPSTLAGTWDGTGWFAAPTLTAPGRWLLSATVTGDAAGSDTVAAFAVDVTASATYPQVQDVLTYLGLDETSYSLDAIDAALQAESAAQRQWCSPQAVYPPDLREALMRRVARNLAARAVPLSTFSSFDGMATSTRVPSTDPEVERLEAPYRVPGIA